MFGCILHTSGPPSPGSHIGCCCPYPKVLSALREAQEQEPLSASFKIGGIPAYPL
jgi:hypothetical protein